MKIAFVSDTHGFEGAIKFPDCDVLVHCGDICSGFGDLGSVENIAYCFEELKKSGKVGEIILVSGNHDTNFISKPEMSRALLKRGCHYLENQELVIDGITFFGMSYLDPIFPEQLFARLADQELRRQMLYELIPEDVDVLITHHPPDIPKLSETFDGYNLGCPILLRAVERVKPRIHSFGHVHNGHGIHYDGVTTFINAANDFGNYQIDCITIEKKN